MYDTLSVPMELSRLYKNCRLCPRACGVDRLAGADGFCGESAQLRLAFAGLHRGEEPPLTGKGGSGTVFVSGCNLGCAFCQNWQISHGETTGGGGKRLGRAVSTDEFAALCLELQNRGAENINIVTGSHAVPAIVQCLSAAKTAGLRLPVLWNSSGYESPGTLELLDGHIDTWLPDLKTLDSGLAARFFNAPDYPQVAAQAILWMIRNRPHRVIIRHLILPGHLESTRAALRWFADNAQGNAQLSLMTQYTPIGGSTPISGAKHAPGRFLDKREYETVLGWLGEFGIEDGFCQELLTGSDWLPDFSRPNPFSSDLSVAVWHFFH
jgi:putative pyruvate formate lyase activating enzyme